MRNSKLLCFEAAALEDEVLVASIDCFDTLLLRESKSEPVRWLEIAARQLDALHDNGIDCSAGPKDMVHHRSSATRLWMRDASVRSRSQHGMYDAILSMIASELGLPEQAIEILANTEMKYELSVLRPNKPLIDVLQRLAAHGKRVISISDMYLSGRQIQRLIREIWAQGRFIQVYSSADLGVTKSTGGLYRKVLHLEGIKAHAMVHGGDSKRADVLMARRHGIRSVHMPRAWTHRMQHFAYRAVDKFRELIQSGLHRRAVLSAGP